MSEDDTSSAQEFIMFPSSPRANPSRSPRSPRSSLGSASPRTAVDGSSKGKSKSRSEVRESGAAGITASDKRIIPATSGLGYLFLHSPDERESDDLVETLAETSEGKARFVRRGGSRMNSVHGSLMEAIRKEEEDQELVLEPEEAYYLIHQLVRGEIKYELRNFWRLRSAQGGIDESSMSLEELPLSAFILREFAFKLPLIRDTASPGTTIPSFFTRGILPLIHRIHDDNYSDKMDTGEIGLIETLGGYVIRAIEEFLTVGIRLTLIGSNSPQPARLDPQPPLIPFTFNRQPPDSPSLSSKSTIEAASGSRFSFNKLFRGKSSTPSSKSPSPLLNLSPSGSDASSAVSPPMQSTPWNIITRDGESEQESMYDETTDEEQEDDDDTATINETILNRAQSSETARTTIPTNEMISLFPVLHPRSSNGRESSVTSVDSNEQDESVEKKRAAIPWTRAPPVWTYPRSEQLAYGGFHADVVGVRVSLLSQAFIIRVKRPERLDEFVLRTEEQFVRFGKILDKSFPLAHIRRVPSEGKKEEPLTITATSLPSPVRRASTVSGNASSSNPAVVDMALKRRATTGAASVFAEGDSAKPADSTVALPSHLINPVSAADKKLPPYDTYRRQLRNWLRDSLSVRGVGHHTETAAFLLLGSLVPKRSDVKDIEARREIDASRRSARAAIAFEGAARVKRLSEAWEQVKLECIHSNGLSDISEALRTIGTIDELPDRYIKSIEFLRSGLASAIFDIFVAGDDQVFSKFKSLYAMFPTLARALKLSNIDSVMNKLSGLFSSKSFGGKIIDIILNDEEKIVQAELARLRSKIGSTVACEKIDLYVYSSAARQASIRHFATINNSELAFVIVRGGDEPRLAAWDLQRVLAAEPALRTFLKTKPTSQEKSANTQTNVRLGLDLVAYLKAVSLDRDHRAIRTLLADPKMKRAFEELQAPLIQLVRRINSIPGERALADLTRALDQFVIVIEALRARVQEPQKSIRMIMTVLLNHEQSLYAFLHRVHCGDSLIEDLLRLLRSAMMFVRDKSPGSISLADLLPESDDGRRSVLEELEELVAYHRRKAVKMHSSLCRRFAGDVDGDDPVVVQGDGTGRSSVVTLVDLKVRPPTLYDIPKLVDRFRAQVNRVLSF